MNKIVLIVGIAAVATIAGVAGWTYHEQPQFCATCHIMQPYLDSWNGSDFLVQAHAEADLACLDCHEPTLEQQVQELVLYVKKEFEDPLETRQYPDEWCLRCHEHGSYDDLIERTEDYTVRDEKVNPHAITVDPANPDDPHDSGESELGCSKCHKMHRESTGINSCYYACHHDKTFESCSSAVCHGEDW